MAISFTRYIDITSGVGATNIVPQREFIGRLFTTSYLVPSQSMIDFTNASEVGTYFGDTSDEYMRAVAYFSWISKNITSPQKITYARWVEFAEPPMIFGNVNQSQTLLTYTSITSGSFGLTIGGVSNTFTGLNFSSATSLSDVASIIQAAINAESGTQWTAATVVFGGTQGRPPTFDFTGGDPVVATITVQEGLSGTPIAGLLGWLFGAIVSNGSLAETITQTLTNSAQTSNNFGSFLFVQMLSLSQITEAATWNSLYNVYFMYLVPLSDLTQLTNYETALSSLAGTGVTYAPLEDDYPEQLPMQIFAATNYNASNSVQNYMFQFANLIPSVSDDTTATILDAGSINYYGVTQTAGQQIAFYQRGVLMGQISDPLDMNVYANEAWFKDAAGAALMNLLSALPNISANQQGIIQISNTLQSVINQALNNGTISVGKQLNNTQILYINEITNNNNAWQQVQNIGYWLNVQIVQVSGQYQAVYTLIYSKDDDVRKIVGTHDLI